MLSLAVLILTHNEEQNIRKCIESILPLTGRIFIVDSGSTDETVSIARSMGATVTAHEWSTYAEQFNWGLDHFDFGTEWVMRMDADEELTPGLIDELHQVLEHPAPDLTGIFVRRRVYFLGRWIRYGGYYPTWLLRVFRWDVGRCETQWMDEHIVVREGRTIRLYADIIDRNNKDLTFWTDKHNQYASREVRDVIERQRERHTDQGLTPSLRGSQAQARRWAKENLYERSPLFLRAFAYFTYRYLFRLGFLDGVEGLIFHFLQGFWYRFLVDAKLYEQRKNAGKSGC